VVEEGGETFEGNLTDYEFDGCTLLPTENKCERLVCEDGELLIAHFESCCSGDTVGAEPALECEVAHEEEMDVTARTWGLALAAVIMVSAASLVGIFIILTTGGKLNRMLLNDASALAIGVLLAAVFVHILPETAEHGTFDWENGSFFLGGIFTALVIKMVAGTFGHAHDPSDLDLEQSGKVVTLEDDPSLGDSPKQVNHALVANIVVGDGFHNLVDGMIIGTAFTLCSGTTGWVTTAAVLAHEVPQEIIDFMILVHAGLSVWKALFFNFLSSLTSFIGVITVLALSGDISEDARGYMLAFGAGFLAFVALAELVPSIVNLDSPQRKAMRTVLIMAGILCIGLLNLFHEHCDAGHDHGHDDGHNH